MKNPKQIRIINLELIDFIKNHCPSIVDFSPPPVDAHHVISRGAHGPDAWWNLMPLTRSQHQEVHKIGLTKFSRKYPSVKIWLESANWIFDQKRNKWFHPEQ